MNRRKFIALSAGLFAAGCGSGNSSGNSARKRSTISSIPVILYHGLSEKPEKGNLYTLGLDSFTEQVRYLHQQGYQTISPAQYVDWFKGNGNSLPAKPILITFDDGESSAQQALPIMAKYGFRATMYVATGLTDNSYLPNDYYSTWETLARGPWYTQFHAGQFGHATITGPSEQRFYETASLPAINVDVSAGMTKLHEKLGVRPLTMALPWGSWNSATVSYFAEKFEVVFVQEATYPAEKSAIRYRMRYRFDVTNPCTLERFVDNLADPRFRYPG